MSFPSLEELLGLRWLSTWVPNRTYQVNDGVIFDGTVYICIALNRGVVPTDTGSWVSHSDSVATVGQQPTASSTVLGSVKVGTTLGISSGVLDYTLPTASSSVLGAVKVGSSLSISSGVLDTNDTIVPKLAADNTFAGITTLGKAVNPKAISPVMSGASISVDPTLGNTFILNGVSSVQTAQTVNLASSPPAGEFIYVIAKASASGTVTYTYGTHFKPSATSVVTLSKTMSLVFISDGTDAWEISRSGLL